MPAPVDAWKDHYLEDVRESRKTGVPFEALRLKRFQDGRSDAPAPVPCYERQ